MNQNDYKPITLGQTLLFTACLCLILGALIYLNR